MVLYVFEEVKTGKHVDKFFNPNDVPTIGSLMQEKGVWYRRLPSLAQVSAQVARTVHGYPRLSNALPPTVAGCRIERDKKSGRKKPLVTSQRHEREVIARNNLAEMD